MARCLKILLTTLLLVLSACNLSTQPPTAEPLDVPIPNTGGKPVVVITSPDSGSEVTVGTQVLVTATATDTVGVTRVQLIANQQIVKTVSSEAPSGQNNFQAVLDYTPRQEGNVSLQVVAYRGAIASDPAQVDIVVRATAAQVTATIDLSGSSGPVIDPNDPTCRALTNTGLNVRTGPATNYDKVTTLAAGTVVPIIGRIADNSWWQIRFGVTIGWVNAPFTSVYGICTAVPVVVPPPTPTTTAVTPTPTLTPLPTLTRTPLPTATPGTPDLVIAGIGGPTDVALPSSAVTYAITISNTGSGPSGSFANQVTLPDGTTADLAVVSNLNPGESISLNVNFTFTTAGTYQLQARADSANQVKEFSEVNNSGSLTINVTGP
jgi:CARDB protein/SH3 domain-containing protein/Big-like domain-containing protein